MKFLGLVLAAASVIGFSKEIHAAEILKDFIPRATLLNFDEKQEKFGLAIERSSHGGLLLHVRIPRRMNSKFGIPLRETYDVGAYAEEFLIPAAKIFREGEHKGLMVPLVFYSKFLNKDQVLKPRLEDLLELPSSQYGPFHDQETDCDVQFIVINGQLLRKIDAKDQSGSLTSADLNSLAIVGGDRNGRPRVIAHVDLSRLKTGERLQVAGQPVPDLPNRFVELIHGLDTVRLSQISTAQKMRTMKALTKELNYDPMDANILISRLVSPENRLTAAETIVLYDACSAFLNADKAKIRVVKAANSMVQATKNDK